MEHVCRPLSSVTNWVWQPHAVTPLLNYHSTRPDTRIQRKLPPVLCEVRPWANQTGYYKSEGSR